MTNPELHEVQDEYVRLPQDIDFDTLLEVLVKANIPLDKYGIENAKTVQHLLNEIEEGESTLSVNSKGELRRELSVLWVDVFCKHSDGSTYLLKEEKQVFKNRQKGERVRKLSSSLGEKLKLDEDSEAAVYRALSEELGIKGALDAIEYLGEDQKMHTPDSFPGLKSVYRFYMYSVVIPGAAFKPEGYIEDQVDKINYYTWDKVSETGQSTH